MRLSPSILVFFISAMCLFMTRCVPDNKIKSTKIAINLSNKEVREIINLQDKHDIKSLYRYFKDENPTNRYLALMAFGSIQDPTAVDSLYPMLNDPVMEVRSAAAYAIGQSGNIKATDKLIAAFSSRDTLDINNEFNSNILEAVGKLGAASDLKALATIKTYRTTDTLLLLGQSRAIYRMALRE